MSYADEIAAQVFNADGLIYRGKSHEIARRADEEIERLRASVKRLEAERDGLAAKSQCPSSDAELVVRAATEYPSLSKVDFSAAECAAMVAEIDRLRAEVARLKIQLESLQGWSCLYCDHCGDIAIESSTGLFEDGAGGKCMSCGFPGSVTCDSETPASWRVSDDVDAVCTDQECDECEDKRSNKARGELAEAQRELSNLRGDVESLRARLESADRASEAAKAVDECLTQKINELRAKLERRTGLLAELCPPSCQGWYGDGRTPCAETERVRIDGTPLCHGCRVSAELATDTTAAQPAPAGLRTHCTCGVPLSMGERSCYTCGGGLCERCCLSAKRAQSAPAEEMSHEECSECGRSFGDLAEMEDTGKCVDCAIDDVPAPAAPPRLGKEPIQPQDTGEVTTYFLDNLRGFEPFADSGADDGASMQLLPDGTYWHWEEARGAAIGDIRANIERVAKPLRERIAELRYELDGYANQEASWKELLDGVKRERDELRARWGTWRAANTELRAKVAELPKVGEPVKRCPGPELYGMADNFLTCGSADLDDRGNCNACLERKATEPRQERSAEATAAHNRGEKGVRELAGPYLDGWWRSEPEKERFSGLRNFAAEIINAIERLQSDVAGKLTVTEEMREAGTSYSESDSQHEADRRTRFLVTLARAIREEK